MKLEVIGAKQTNNYTREEDEVDEVHVLWIEGTEHDLVCYLADQFLYRVEPEEPQTIEKLLSDGIHQAYDGCGAITFIKDVEKNRILFDGDKHGFKHYFPYVKEGQGEYTRSWRSQRGVAAKKTDTFQQITEADYG